jgi:hypothetical protein
MAEARDAAEQLKCSCCKLDVGPDENGLGSSSQIRCKSCSSVFSRLQRLKANGTKVPRLAEQSPNSRVKFMKDAGKCFGDELTKLINTSATVTQLRKAASVFCSHGEYVEIEGPEGIKEKWKETPVKLNNLLEHSTRMVCPVTKCEYVWVPQYKMSTTTEECESEELKRRMHTEERIKPVKKAKIDKPPRAKGVAGAGQEPAEAVPEILSSVQLEKVQKSINMMQDVQLKLGGAIMTASAEDMQGFIGLKVIEAANLTKSELEATLDKVNAINRDKVALPKTLPGFFKDMNAMVAKAKISTKKLKTLTDDAKAD